MYILISVSWGPLSNFVPSYVEQGLAPDIVLLLALIKHRQTAVVAIGRKQLLPRPQSLTAQYKTDV